MSKKVYGVAARDTDRLAEDMTLFSEREIAEAFIKDVDGESYLQVVTLFVHEENIA